VSLEWAVLNRRRLNNTLLIYAASPDHDGSHISVLIASSKFRYNVQLQSSYILGCLMLHAGSDINLHCHSVRSIDHVCQIMPALV